MRVETPHERTLFYIKESYVVALVSTVQKEIIQFKNF